MNRDEFAKMLEHTLLCPTSTVEDVVRECAIAADLNVGVMVVQPHFTERIVKELRGSAVRTAAVLSFPHGCDLTDVKMTAAARMRDRGIDEIDMVIHLGYLKSGMTEAVQRDIAAVVQASDEAVIKVIIESSELSRDEIILACHLCREAGAHFVKTSTGFAPTGGATEEAVRLMRKSIAPQMGVKASGGIRDLKTALKMIQAGASRLGVSGTVKILSEWEGIAPLS